MKGLNLIGWQHRLREHYNGYILEDREGAWRVLSAFVDEMVLFPDKLVTIAQHLEFWMGLYQGLDVLFEEVLSSKVKLHEEQALNLDKRLKDIQDAIQKRRSWIDHIKMVVEIQALKTEPILRLEEELLESSETLEKIQAEKQDLEQRTKSLVEKVERKLG
jgi:hypothetical protein